ncbi:hypothetical protein MLD38_038505 [Melastoma candidum]|uniref:Uncharacterized protein n=1 Tax=Melastoma candidum TaxID=119954 RepID=A0ACB9KZD4_9MYRT|nr:hypothetical protein MLD38_038505 [Melastoma candidum]
MKCESVACIWSSSAPSQHRVTASAALDCPPTLYTGGADGSIFWWNLSVSDSDPSSRAEIRAVAMLCGHAAPIADLEICYPSAASWNDRTDSSGSSLADDADQEKNYVILVDYHGRTQKVPLSKDALHPDVGYGNVIAFLFFSCCLFKHVDTNVTIGKISFSGDCFSHYAMDSSQIKGCMFLYSAFRRRLTFSDSSEAVPINFMVWDAMGSAVIYLITFCNEIFKVEPLLSLDASSHPKCMRQSVCFSQLDTYILRIDSVCYQQNDAVLWKPSVTIWLLQFNHVGLHSCEMLGQCDSIDWNANSAPYQGSKGSDCEGYNPNYTTGEKCGASVDNYSYHSEGQTVSSSMIISESSCMPYAIVYGYADGNIEVIKLDMVHRSYSSGCQPNLDVNLDSCRRYFSGHTSSVLCLASHRMVGSAKGWDFCYVLISGSKDCTIRIWDLDSGIPVVVLNHHVAPIRQIIFPPSHTERPWIDCFLSIGEDSCVALVSLETLRVERIFPGHPGFLTRVVWDGERGYTACLCRSHGRASDVGDVLYIWDVKSGARERILRGTSAHSMFDHFCSRISKASIGGAVSSGSTSVSSLLTPMLEDIDHPSPHLRSSVKDSVTASVVRSSSKANEPWQVKTFVRRETISESQHVEKVLDRTTEHSINCQCPFPGVASLKFNLTSLILPYQGEDVGRNFGGIHNHNFPSSEIKHDDLTVTNAESSKRALNSDCLPLVEECTIRFSLSLLHSWDVDSELDQLLITDMKLKKPDLILSSGLAGDRGSLTLTFPGRNAVPELWKISSEFSAMRSLTMVSLAQRMVSFHSSSTACSALAAFYTRNLAEKVLDIKAPSLQLLVSFWQDKSEHVRMAARSLFHCAASSKIPLPLCSQTVIKHVKFISSMAGKEEKEPGSSLEERIFESTGTKLEKLEAIEELEESNIMAWLESYEVEDWISCVGGTGQDAMTSRIIVAAALAIWYPSLVKSRLPFLVVHHLVKLVMAMNEKYSSTAAELLAEGMEGTWKTCIAAEIPRLIGDIFFQIECVSSTYSSPSVPIAIRDTLIGILLPSLAMADVHGFLNVIESQIWSTASDSLVHLVSLGTLIRVIRGAPKNLVQYLDKAVSFVLQTIDPSNVVLRKNCFQTALAALKEVVRVFPMVALNETSTRLAVGDAIGDMSNASIRVFDMQSVMKIKVLDASPPPGLPTLLSGNLGTAVTTIISALCFSPHGEGLVAFSEHGLMIRWWSLGSVWWEKLSRNLAPVQCTKVIFVHPWEGFSPKTARKSVMASIMEPDGPASPVHDAGKGDGETDGLKTLIQNLDFSYRLEFAGARKVLLVRHGRELGTFLL